MTYRAAVWHSPKETRTKGLGPVAKFTTLQNKCLRTITGAYRVTNIKVLEVEAGVVLLEIHLDRRVLRSGGVPRCGEFMEV